MKDKHIHLHWIIGIIDTTHKNIQWAIGASFHKTKGSLNLVAKEWRTLVFHRLISTIRDNILSLNKDALAACIMETMTLILLRSL